MVTVKPKAIVTMKMDGACISHARTDVSVRDLRSIIDEPKERGGTNLGPSPTETMMAALVACTNVITHRVAEKNGVHVHGLRIGLEADFDRRGVMMEEEVKVPFPGVRLRIDLTTDADAAAVEKVKRELPMYCPVSKVFQAAGTKVEEIWTVKRP